MSQQTLSQVASERAGCRQLRRSRSTGTVVGIYNAREAHLDEGGGAWVTVCEQHGAVCNHETLRLARDHAADPSGWCEDCRCPTAAVIADMLTECTGTHFLDSGGQSGRAWQQNRGAVGNTPAVRHFRDRPCAELNVYAGERDNGSTYLDLDVTIDLFHWLCGRLRYDADEQARFERWVETQPEDESWHTLKNEWAAQHDETYVGSGPVNSYNSECWLSQTIEFALYDHEGDTYCALQIHGGADVRGGYTAVKIFCVPYDAGYLFDFREAFLFADSDDESVTWHGEDGRFVSDEHGDLSDYPVSFEPRDRGRNRIYVDREERKAYCPVTGAELQAGAHNSI